MCTALLKEAGIITYCGKPPKETEKMSLVFALGITFGKKNATDREKIKADDNRNRR